MIQFAVVMVPWTLAQLAQVALFLRCFWHISTLRSERQFLGTTLAACVSAIPLAVHIVYWAQIVFGYPFIEAWFGDSMVAAILLELVIFIALLTSFAAVYTTPLPTRAESAFAARLLGVVTSMISLFVVGEQVW